MKTIKRLSILVIIASVLTTFSCTKEGKQGETGQQGATGAVGPQGDPGPQAKTFNFNLTFNAGDTYKSYNGITGFDADDVLLVYIFNANYGADYYVQLPYILGGSTGINIYAEFSEVEGFLFINTENANGTSGSPWTSTTTLGFKAVLISSSARLANPDVDYSNYYEVKGYFNLKD
tara:strand:+ start:69 stop:596 length:528 start_codon:yes stop_codon:yes gene_type:complete